MCVCVCVCISRVSPMPWVNPFRVNLNPNLHSEPLNPSSGALQLPINRYG